MTTTRQVARAHGRAVQNDELSRQRLGSVIAAALSVALERAMLQPGCARCVHAAKVADAIALKALEDLPKAEIRQALTWQHGEPVCWEHFEYEPQGGQRVSDGQPVGP